TQADIAARRREQFRDRILKTIELGSLDPYLAMVDELVAAAPSAEETLPTVEIGANQEHGEGRGFNGGKRDLRMIAAAAFRLLEVPEGDTTPSAGEPPPLEADGMGVEPGMVRLFVSAGRRQNVRPQDLVGAIANEAGLRGQEIGIIDI